MGASNNVFPAHAVVSVFCKRMAIAGGEGFAQMHRYFEFLHGRPTYTHELSYSWLWEKISPLARADFEQVLGAVAYEAQEILAPYLDPPEQRPPYNNAQWETLSEPLLAAPPISSAHTLVLIPPLNDDEVMAGLREVAGPDKAIILANPTRGTVRSG